MHNNDYYSLTYFGIINEKWYDYSTVVTLLITYRTHYTIIYLSFCCHNNIIYKNTLTYVCLVRTGQQTYIFFFWYYFLQRTLTAQLAIVRNFHTINVWRILKISAKIYSNRQEIRKLNEILKFLTHYSRVYSVKIPHHIPIRS